MKGVMQRVVAVFVRKTGDVAGSVRETGDGAGCCGFRAGNG